jgi:hypothetical protein
MMHRRRDRRGKRNRERGKKEASTCIEYWDNFLTKNYLHIITTKLFTNEKYMVGN